MIASTPRTLDDLLNVLPGLRRLRSMNADQLRLFLDRKPGECTWCGDQVGKGRSDASSTGRTLAAGSAQKNGFAMAKRKAGEEVEAATLFDGVGA